MVNVPVVPSGGVPLSTAVPLPLSFRFNQAGGVENVLSFHETGVAASVVVSKTWLGTPAVKVAPGEHEGVGGAVEQPEMNAVGAEAISSS